MRFLPEHSLKRLRITLFVFILLLSMPLGALLFLVFKSLQSEEQVRLRSEALRAFRSIIETNNPLFVAENSRRFEDYSFFTLASNSLLSNQESLSFSSLSNLTSETAFPGAIGYFQVTEDGTLQTPLLPDLSETPWSAIQESVGSDELNRRMAVKKELTDVTSSLDVKAFHKSSFEFQKNPEATHAATKRSAEQLGGNAKVQNASSASSDSNQGEQQELYSSQSVRLPQQKFGNYVNQIGLEPLAPSNRVHQKSSEVEQKQVLNLDASEVTMFETRVGFLQYQRLSPGVSGFIRKVTKGEERFLQGFAITDENLLDVLFRKPFLRHTSRHLALEIGFPEGDRKFLVAHEDSHPGDSPQVLFERTLQPPLSGFRLKILANGGPFGTSGAIVIFLAGALLLILTSGLWVLYKLGVAQIRLARERGNFVSAVSHELKTPLTSIRMYAEMLDGGYVESDDKRREYYRYISIESERLSRLVNNVLFYANLEGNRQVLELSNVLPSELLLETASRLRPLIQEAGFQLETKVEDESLPQIRCDKDAFLQMLINLTDNAIKFCAEAENRTLVFRVRLDKAGRVSFYFRDFGPGVPSAEIEKIFGLFYRVESEMTRKTKGTGLGLGLVSALAKQMSARVSVKHESPGLEFQVSFLPLKADLSQS